MTTTLNYQRPPEDPRRAQTRRLILAAARQLLLDEGQEAVNPTRLAALTGISRSTIYRHWQDPTDIIFEATAADTDQLPFAPTGDPKTDLTHYLAALRDMLESPHAKLVATQIERAEHDDETADTLRSLSANRRDLIGDLIQYPATDFTTWHAVIVGPIMFQRFLARQEITDELIALIAEIYHQTHSHPPTT